MRGEIPESVILSGRPLTGEVEGADDRVHPGYVPLGTHPGRQTGK